MRLLLLLACSNGTPAGAEDTDVVGDTEVEIPDASDIPDDTDGNDTDPADTDPVDTDDEDDTDGCEFRGDDDNCDGVDDDCDGAVDEEAPARFEDADGDGAGGAPLAWCDTSGVTNDWDCDDADPTEPTFVEAGASGGNGTLGSPLGTIGEGIAAAGRCVAALPGTYTENVDFGGKAVRVEGVEGPLVTTIVAAEAAPVVTFDDGEGAGSVLAGFTITRGIGETELGDEYLCTSMCCAVCVREYKMRAGVWIDGAAPTLEELVVTGNGESESSYVDGSGVTHVVLPRGSGIGVRDGGLALSESEVSSNSYGAIAGGNDASVYLSASYTGVWTTKFEYSYMDASTGLFTADPLFVAWSDNADWTDDDLHLGSGSPAIDAGNPDPTRNDRDGTRNDAGAYGGPEAFE
jgi:hypothetical protein